MKMKMKTRMDHGFDRERLAIYYYVSQSRETPSRAPKPLVQSQEFELIETFDIWKCDVFVVWLTEEYVQELWEPTVGRRNEIQKEFDKMLLRGTAQMMVVSGDDEMSEDTHSHFHFEEDMNREENMGPYFQVYEDLLFYGAGMIIMKDLEFLHKEMEMLAKKKWWLDLENDIYWESNYVGELNSDGLPHGHGSLLKNGHVCYDGEWKCGKPDGKGTLHVLTEPSGANPAPFYEGTWVNGSLNGFGTLFDALSGLPLFKGHFEQSVKNGFGTSFHYLTSSKNAKTYQGTWKNNHPHGKGVFRNFQGFRTYEGEVAFGMSTGYGILYEGSQAEEMGGLYGVRTIGLLDSKNGSYGCCPNASQNIVHLGTFDQKHGYGVTLNLVSGITVREGDRYNQYYHGQNVIFYNDGQRNFEGEVIYGLKHGFGRVFNHDGVKTYEGYFQADRKHGKGIAWTAQGNLLYEGEFQNDGAHGEGTFYHDNGAISFKGRLEHNQASGRGTRFREDGSKVYEGEFMCGTPNGHGILFFEDGKSKKYEGNFVNDRMNGFGTLFYPSGQPQFTGQFYNGRSDGNGTLYFETGEIQCQGQFKADSMNGHAILFYKSGKQRYVGSFVDNQAHGHGVLYSELGFKVYEGEFRKDVPHGKGTQFYENTSKVKYKGSFVHGKANGPGKTFHIDSGEVKEEGIFYNDRLNGQGKVYRIDEGTIEGNFYDGKAHGEVTLYHSDGHKLFQGTMYHGIKAGEGTLFHPNGAIKYKGTFIDNQPSGQGELYDPNGNLLYRGLWDHAKRLQKPKVGKRFHF